MRETQAGGGYGGGFGNFFFGSPHWVPSGGVVRHSYHRRDIPFRSAHSNLHSCLKRPIECEGCPPIRSNKAQPFRTHAPLISIFFQVSYSTLIAVVNVAGKGGPSLLRLPI